VYALVGTSNSIAERESQVSSLEQQLASTSARAGALQSFSNFASLEQTRTQTVADLAHSRFDWERVLRELALVIPADVSLDNLTGSVSGAATIGDGGGEATSGGQVIDAPTLVMTGCGEGHDAVARFVAALRDIDGVTRVGLASSSEPAATDAADGATGGAPASTGGEAGSCPGTDARFELTVAFDEVQVDSASGGIIAPAAPATPTDDAGGVPEVQQQSQAAQESVESATDSAGQAVDNYVPGT
jgi:Tfp pilus assembly protein PilN